MKSKFLKLKSSNFQQSFQEIEQLVAEKKSWRALAVSYLKNSFVEHRTNMDIQYKPFRCFYCSLLISVLCTVQLASPLGNRCRFAGLMQRDVPQCSVGRRVTSRPSSRPSDPAGTQRFPCRAGVSPFPE